MSKFATNFLQVLKEDDAEREALQASLDDGVDASEFDTNMEPSPDQMQATDEVADAMSRRNQQIIQELQGWITEIEQF